ncbi:MAG: ABC-F family ATP-binding cassette domain-containing protein [Eggerthellaceae bacterium]|nr:ABC-F family ATP-binding cassette domain-containing protein [Eggerthellaceae bacterium]
MSFLLGCEKATVEVPSKTVLSDISLGVNTGDRIGIVGRNGDGKSTLLRLLYGQIEPDDGRVITTRGTRIGFLGQRDSLDGAASVKSNVVGDTPEYVWASDPKVRSILEGLLSDVDWQAKVETLSGGQRRRVDLARILVGDWDVLMLDEPTNHLDIKAITWLAEHLKTRWRAAEGALLTVTHDRWFLDEVCNTMWEVHDGKVDPFEGGFSAYIMQRVERDRIAALTEQKRQNMLRRELAWLSRGARARATKPKFHVAAAKELIADVPELRNPIELKRMAMARIGKQVVDLENASVRFGDKTVLDDITWMIGPGDRFGIVGGNGVGKTTLLRLIEGVQKPTSGRVRTGSTVRFAVLSQHLDALKEFGDDRVRQVVSRFSRRTMLDGKETTPSQLLERLGFEKADLNEPVSDLSGGQRRRLALMMILLEEPNVLILDEPGNDLDIDMLAAVEDLLDGWPGTLLLVTHDRYLMERVTDDQFAIIDGKLRHLPGGIDEYLALVEKREASAGAVGASTAEITGPNAADADKLVAGESEIGFDGKSEGKSTNGAQAPKLSNNEMRALKKLMQSNEKKMATTEQRIADAEAALAEVDPSDYVALTEAQVAIDELRARLEELEIEWFEAAEKLGE